MVGVREKYVREYYARNYGSVLREGFDKEMRAHGDFLARQVTGRTLDFGCGPSMHVNALFMINASSIDGIDAVPENVAFARQKIVSFRPKEYHFVEGFMRKYEPNYSLTRQIRKVGNVTIADFTKPLPPTLKKGSYDCVVSTYSIGCVKTLREYETALRNAFELLKQKGVFLALNTDGCNKNKIVPEMTYQGLDQGTALLKKTLNKVGFQTITTKKVKIAQGNDSMYKYSNLLLTTARR